MSEGRAAKPPPPFFTRYGITRTGDAAAPLIVEPYPEVCRAGILRPTVLAAAVDIVGSLFARQVVPRDGIFTIDLSVRAPLRAAPKRLVTHGALLRAGRSQVASETRFEIDGAPFAYGQTIFQRAPGPGSPPPPGSPPARLPEVIESFPLQRPLAEEAGVIVRDASRGHVEVPIGPALSTPQGFMQGAVVGLVLEEAALALAEHDGAGACAVTELDIRYLASARVGPVVSEAEWVGGRESAMVRIILRDCGSEDRITTAGLARVARAAA